MEIEDLKKQGHIVKWKVGQTVGGNLTWFLEMVKAHCDMLNTERQQHKPTLISSLLFLTKHCFLLGIAINTMWINWSVEFGICPKIRYFNRSCIEINAINIQWVFDFSRNIAHSHFCNSKWNWSSTRCRIGGLETANHYTILVSN